MMKLVKALIHKKGTLRFCGNVLNGPHYEEGVFYNNLYGHLQAIEQVIGTYKEKE